MNLIDDCKAKYIYCIGENPGNWPSEVMGVEGSLVYHVVYRDIAAVVHDCAEQPYNSDDNNKVIDWVLGHQLVVDKACSCYSSVLPFTFNSIVKGKEDLSSHEILVNWLEDNYDNFKLKLGKIKGKKEYSVQLFLDKQVSLSLLQSESDILELQVELLGSAKGKAYFVQEKINKKIGELMANRADSYCRQFYHEISSVVSECKLCKLKQAGRNEIMIINLVCLAGDNEVEVLGDVLEKIKSNDIAIKIKFSGPWPAYSFV
ncbi:Gas vesicle synthesis GvpLGvpF [Desulfofarcimen acetoxidans DSM 771]|uniref:Gas vesicle synthesis GvpLGvpF n=1 Tax=Desulfofarcimen acetoxidans (strain ATCC 49208 / DSM 771 / KCTC 5769 / VKM B-1644 / 5575) TaxID=485916 RepID=C8W3I9_DESAS|nr:GvpL/GvpF family gas vesicle protein [Desulfofarcimen acetoxidans]ACV63775.1 Gas vesicle synthesis GvpLGvpF [Desulfofarcimen acetoxidans DSM 771]